MRMEGAHLIFTEQYHSEWKWVREGDKEEGGHEKHRLKQNAKLQDQIGSVVHGNNLFYKC